MISKYLSAIDGISAYPIFSLFIFVPFFVLVTIWVFKLDKQFLTHMMNMPLEQTADNEGKRDSI